MRPASKTLLSKMRDIAGALMDTESSGDRSTTVTLTGVHPKYVRELGTLLLHLAKGEDVRRLFPRSKPTKERDHKNAALAYWARFAVDHDVAAASDAARAILPALSSRTIADIKGKYRKRSLKMLNLDGRRVTYEISKGIEIKAPSKAQYAAMIAHLRKKEARTRRP